MDTSENTKMTKTSKGDEVCNHTNAGRVCGQEPRHKDEIGPYCWRCTCRADKCTKRRVVGKNACPSHGCEAALNSQPCGMVVVINNATGKFCNDCAVRLRLLVVPFPVTTDDDHYDTLWHGDGDEHEDQDKHPRRSPGQPVAYVGDLNMGYMSDDDNSSDGGEWIGFNNNLNTDGNLDSLD